MEVIQVNLCHVFGLSAETTQAMPVFTETEDGDIAVVVFEGFVINVPFLKILLGRLLSDEEIES